MQPTTESPLAARLAELGITATATLVRKPLVRTYKRSRRDKAQPYDELPYSDPQAKGHEWRDSAHQWRVSLEALNSCRKCGLPPTGGIGHGEGDRCLRMGCEGGVLGKRTQLGPVDYWTGSAHVTPYKESPSGMFTVGGKPTPPSAADVLSSLLLDGQACEQSFADWCGEFGYDTDSRKAFDVYAACQASGDKLRRFLSAELIAELRNLEH